MSPAYAEARLLLANSLWDNGRIEEAGVEYNWFVNNELSLPVYATERLSLLRELRNRQTPVGGEGL